MGTGAGRPHMRLLRQLWIVIGTLVGAFVVSWLVYMPDSDERGVWRAQTGGQILTLNMWQAKLYSESTASCVLDLTFPAHMKLVEFAEGATIAVEADTLVLSVDSTLDDQRFDRIEALPAPCTEPDPNAPPIDVFNALWSAMDEHYAFFDLHGVDWDARRALAPSGPMTDAELFALLSDTLAGLDDGHVQLGAPVGYFSPALAPDWLDVADPPSRAALWQTARDIIGADLIPVELTAIEYALLADGIGYVMIRETDLNTPFGAKEGPAMALAFSEVAEVLKDASAIILDLRYNPGGSDGAAFGLASHFTARPVDVFTKTTRNGDGQTAPFTATLLPFDTTPLNQPVIVLTTKLTGSAAEILTLALRELPHVTTMGEPTSGGLSDSLAFKLPNGWDLDLSHQTYRTMDGQIFEAVGIPPDIPFSIEAAPLRAGQDPLLRAAFARARGN